MYTTSIWIVESVTHDTISARGTLETVYQLVLHRLFLVDLEGIFIFRRKDSMDVS